MTSKDFILNEKIEKELIDHYRDKSILILYFVDNFFENVEKIDETLKEKIVKFVEKLDEYIFVIRLENFSDFNLQYCELKEKFYSFFENDVEKNKFLQKSIEILFQKNKYIEISKKIQKFEDFENIYNILDLNKKIEITKLLIQYLKQEKKYNICEKFAIFLNENNYMQSLIEIYEEYFDELEVKNKLENFNINFLYELFRVVEVKNKDDFQKVEILKIILQKDKNLDLEIRINCLSEINRVCDSKEYLDELIFCIENIAKNKNYINKHWNLKLAKTLFKRKENDDIKKVFQQKLIVEINDLIDLIRINCQKVEDIVNVIEILKNLQENELEVQNNYQEEIIEITFLLGNFYFEKEKNYEKCIEVLQDYQDINKIKELTISAYINENSFLKQKNEILEKKYLELEKKLYCKNCQFNEKYISIYNTYYKKCNYCSHDLCEDCQIKCENCYKIYCINCIEKCKKCLKNFCLNCKVKINNLIKIVSCLQKEILYILRKRSSIILNNVN